VEGISHTGFHAGSFLANVGITGLGLQAYSLAALALLDDAQQAGFPDHQPSSHPEGFAQTQAGAGPEPDQNLVAGRHLPHCCCDCRDVCGGQGNLDAWRDFREFDRATMLGGSETSSSAMECRRMRQVLKIWTTVAGELMPGLSLSVKVDRVSHTG